MPIVARLFLVDGMSHLYRAYFAIKGLTNRQGQSTNAIFGFTTMLRKLVDDESPDYLAVAMDLEGPTVRHQQFAAYKATRARMPDDLAEQVPHVGRLCAALRIPVVTCPGYEADDVIATLTARALESGLEVVIVTIDKDMFQLVSDRVTVLDTRTGTRFDPAAVEAKWGVRPDQIVDMLSLVGDSSDNIPGAPGIGEKGAASLIAEFGSLDRLLEEAGRVTRKAYRESLEQNADQIRKSRELIRIHSQLPLDVELGSLRHRDPDWPALRNLFEEFGFTSLLRELPDTEPAFAPRTRAIQSEADLDVLLRRCSQGQVGVAAWFSPEEGEVQGLALSYDGNEAWFLSATTLRERPQWLDRLLTGSGRWVFHDLKPWRLAVGDGPRRGLPRQVGDTMLMAYLLSPNDRDFTLERIASEYLKLNVTEEGAGSGLLGEVQPEALGRRAAAVRRLADSLETEVSSKGLERLLHEIEIPLVEVLADMESCGVRIDPALLAAQSEELAVEIDQLSRAIYELAGQEFNLNSPKQLADVLFGKLQLPSAGKSGKAGHLSTGVEVLEELAEEHEIVQKILDYRELTKLKNTYLDALPKLIRPGTGRIHTSYNQMVAATGRLSSSNPNLQNIPVRTEQGRRIRKAFVPEPGFRFLAADYSQIELRIMAHLSEDPVLVDAFRNDEDVHERTAREVFGTESGLDPRELRRRAKVINFGIIYGLSAFGLARSLKIPRGEAQKFIEDYFHRYHGVREWLDRTAEDARRLGYVSTLFGRIRPIPEINSRNWSLREFARRTAINAPIQGTAADLMKRAMIAISRRMSEEGYRARLVLQVHDELVFEVPPDEMAALRSLVCGEMEQVVELSVPLRVEAAEGDSWYDAK